MPLSTKDTASIHPVANLEFPTTPNVLQKCVCLWSPWICLETFQVLQKPSTRFIWRNDRWIPSYACTQLTWYFYVIRGSLKPEARHVRDIDVDINVGEIQKVKFLWNNKVINLFRPTLGASQITVQSGVDGKEYVSDIPSLVSFMILPVYASSHPSNPSPTHLNILCHLPRMGLCCFVGSSFFHPFPSFFYPFSPFTLDQRGKKG